MLSDTPNHTPATDPNRAELASGGVAQSDLGGICMLGSDVIGPNLNDGTWLDGHRVDRYGRQLSQEELATLVAEERTLWTNLEAVGLGFNGPKAPGSRPTGVVSGHEAPTN